MKPTRALAAACCILILPSCQAIMGALLGAGTGAAVTGTPQGAAAGGAAGLVVGLSNDIQNWISKLWHGIFGGAPAAAKGAAANTSASWRMEVWQWLILAVVASLVIKYLWSPTFRASVNQAIRHTVALFPSRVPPKLPKSPKQ